MDGHALVHKRAALDAGLWYSLLPTNIVLVVVQWQQMHCPIQASSHHNDRSGRRVHNGHAANLLAGEAYGRGVFVNPGTPPQYSEFKGKVGEIYSGVVNLG